MISFSSRGDFAKTESFLNRLAKIDAAKVLDRYGQAGVEALRGATPVDTGLAARSWSYKIDYSGGGATITWLNHDVESGFPVAIMLQYGHGTGTGGYVQGRDYINPAMRPIFNKIAQEVKKLVKSG